MSEGWVSTQFRRARDIVLGRSGGRYQRNFMRLANANIMAQSLNFMFLPIISRIFTPAQFGVLTLFLAVQRLLVAIVCIRFDWSIPNCRTRDEARYLLWVSVASALAGTLLSLVLVLLLHDSHEKLRGLFVVPGTTLLLPLAVFSGGLIIILRAWFVREGDLSMVGTARLVQVAINNVLAVIAGLFAAGSVGLIAAFVAGQWANAGYLAKFLREAVRFEAGPTWSGLRAAVGAFSTEAFFSTGVAIVNISIFSAPPLLIGAIYGTDAAGKYGMVLLVCLGPLGILTGALSSSFWSEASIRMRDGKEHVLRLYFGTMRKLALLGIAVLPCLALASTFIDYIFGIDQWRGLGWYVLAVLPYVFASVVFSPTNHLVIYRKQHWQLFSDLLALLFVLIIFGLAYTYDLPPVLTVFYMSCALLVTYVLRALLHLKANQDYDE